ncbi:Cu(+)/Ag(+) efflux RND transporter periplasmic metallochaperone CusF, partial [Escherichia coli]|nr:Cu(+)/Ag(+) efflux RND transporter periplasmic metallochaperone CusF [Escherichia coli]
QTKMSGIKTGDKVAFNFVQQGNLSLLQDIKVSQ